jgi:gluconolactonase
MKRWATRVLVWMTTWMGCTGAEDASLAAGRGGMSAPTEAGAISGPPGDMASDDAGSPQPHRPSPAAQAGIGGTRAPAAIGGAAQASGRGGAAAAGPGAGAGAGGEPAAPLGGTGAEPAMPPADYPALTAEMFGMPKLISDQFKLSESPVWDHCGDRLLFVDVNNRKIHSYKPDAEIEEFAAMTNYVNGIIFDRDGNLLMAEMGGGQGGKITRMDMRTKQIEVLIDHDPRGNKLKTSDDLALRSDGTIYFTDPIISHGPYSNSLGSLATHSFYRLLPPASDGTREIVAMGTAGLPNGIRLSPDEKTLYVAGFVDDNIVKYDVMDDGSLTRAGTFVSAVDKADSFCMDAGGNIYLGVGSGLQVVSPDGKKLKLLRLSSSDGITNCGFGGADGKTLWITGWNVLYQLDNMPIPGLDWERNKSISCN